MSEPTESMTWMQILECADDIRKKFNRNGRIISKYNLDFFLDTLETLLDPSQPAADEEGPAPLDNAETSAGQSWTDPRVTPDAAPDDLVERTRAIIVEWSDDITPETRYEREMAELLHEWLACERKRANLRPTREEAEVSNPGPHVVWSEVMVARDPSWLLSTYLGEPIQFLGIGCYEVGKRYRVTVTEADDTPEEGRNG